jgi:drug/metabolite transporter (DMT)-like permease
MMYWLFVAILAYLFFGLGSFGDKLVLAGKPKPKSYTFYVGVFGLSSLLLIPFASFSFPSSTALVWLILNAVVRILGTYAMFVALEKFDVSRVMATIGATQPIFIFALTWVFWGPQIMTVSDIIAFVLLFLGSVIISIEKNIKTTEGYLLITTFSSLMFSLAIVFTKLVFENQDFVQGTVWMCIFVFLLSLVFLLSKKSRKEIFAKKIVSNQKTQKAFLLAQISGGAANFLQGYSIYLAPVVFLAIINSLRGIQYIFLFVITIFVSVFFPKILKEDLSRKVVIQKVISIILVVVGLMILAVY